MSTLTDPAKELVDLCGKLSEPSKAKGDIFLASKFGVEPWSAEFFQIVFAISERIEYLKNIVSTLDMDEDIRTDAIQHLARIRNAFSPSGLSNPWEHSVKNFIDPTNVQPIKMLSSEVRKVRPFPKLEDSEIAQLLAEVRELITWLEEFQIKDRDFIREALLAGLRQFEFRLARIGWLGWGYTLESMRDVIAAYMALERSVPNLAASPDAHAVLRKVKAVASTVLEKTQFAKNIVETGDFALKAYAVTMTYLASPQVIAGLIPLLK